VQPMLTNAQRDILIRHIDGSSVVLGGELAIQRSSINAMIRRGLLRTSKVSKWRMETVITPKGRETLAAVLADWAEAILRAKWPTSLLLPDPTGKIAEAEELGKGFDL
jgi:hypothetical protein